MVSVMISITVMVSISVQTFSAVSPSKPKSFDDNSFNEFGNLSSTSLKKKSYLFFVFKHKFFYGKTIVAG